MNEKNYFRIVGLLEGTSLIILMFIAVPLKRIYGYPQAVSVVGAVHGLLFLTYVYTLLTYASDQKWTKSKTLLAFVLSALPFGTFWFDRKYLSKHAEAPLA
jgi:integral membrane protein